MKTKADIDNLRGALLNAPRHRGRLRSRLPVFLIGYTTRVRLLELLDEVES